jgi:hypothetical protein
MLDRRKSCRGRVYYGARIAFNERRSTLSCILRNFSLAGARADIEDPNLLADEFDLTIDSKGLAFRAHKIWQRGRAAGFAFRDPRQVSVAMRLDWALRLRAAERANKVLQQRIAQLSNEL